MESKQQKLYNSLYIEYVRRTSSPKRRHFCDSVEQYTSPKLNSTGILSLNANKKSYIDLDEIILSQEKSS